MRGLISAAILIGMASIAQAAETVTIKAADGARQPQITVDESERIHLTFGIGNSVYYTFSLDRGATFGAADRSRSTEASRPRNATRSSDCGSGRLGDHCRHRGPRRAVAAMGDLFTWRSQDRGRTWQGPARVNDVSSSAREGLHALAGATNGDLFCVWLDLRNKDTQIFGSRSTDSGATWSQNILIYKSPDGSVCECCHPSVAYGGDGFCTSCGETR